MRFNKVAPVHFMLEKLAGKSCVLVSRVLPTGMAGGRGPRRLICIAGTVKPILQIPRIAAPAKESS